MRRNGERHPFFEFVVFGFALLLVAILLFYGARAFMARRLPQAPQSAVAGPGPTTPSAAGSATETAVLEIPPVRLSRAGGLRGRTKVDVPAPQGSAKR